MMPDLWELFDNVFLIGQTALGWLTCDSGDSGDHLLQTWCDNQLEDGEISMLLLSPEQEPDS